MWLKNKAVPDGDFSTVKSPNPEEQAHFDMQIELGKKVGADAYCA